MTVHTTIRSEDKTNKSILTLRITYIINAVNIQHVQYMLRPLLWPPTGRCCAKYNVTKFKNQFSSTEMSNIKFLNILFQFYFKI
jgi:hypothetical protein